MIMSEVPCSELQREFRVVGQTLSMHSMLRDRYARRALVLDVILLGCSVVFCATTFVGDDLFAFFSVPPRTGRYAIGLVATAAFFSSLVALRVDWKGLSARHRDAGDKLSSVLALFRKLQHEDKTWPKDRRAELHAAYWETVANVVEIPAAQFVCLKAKHLRKVQVSKVLDSVPGCPILLARLVVLCRCIQNLCRKGPPDQSKSAHGVGEERDAGC